jgi:O-antigen ligase
MAIHNIFFAYLAATGYPGLTLFLISLGAVFVGTLRRSLRAPREYQILSIGLLAGLVGFLAYAFWTTMHNSTIAMAIFWGVCGVAVGADASKDSAH